MSTNQVSLNSAMRSNLLSLQNTSKQVAQTQVRLSTGQKVNTAMDNPTNYFAALPLHAKSDHLSISREAYEKFQQSQSADSLTLADTNEEALKMTMQSYDAEQSKLEDTDIAEESTKLAKAQSLEQASLAMLSKANTTDKAAVMALLR